jgi:protein TonB
MPRLSRVMSWSFGIHFGVLVTLFLMPREWLVRRVEKPPVMTISLGGSAQERTTGTNPLGGRTVEQVAPPPKRPEPIRPAPKPPPTPVLPKPTAAPPIRGTTAKPTPPPPAPAPVTGPRIARGSTPVDTGASGQGAGLTTASGLGTSGETNLQNFCCPEYLSGLVHAIDSQWNRASASGERGVTIIRFEVQRNGAITNQTVTTSSGSPSLDRLARGALANARLRPLPAEYTEDTLIIHLRFPYGGP